MIRLLCQINHARKNNILILRLNRISKKFENKFHVNVIAQYQ
jgi:hypothetical protein